MTLVKKENDNSKMGFSSALVDLFLRLDDVKMSKSILDEAVEITGQKRSNPTNHDWLNNNLANLAAGLVCRCLSRKTNRPLDTFVNH